MGVYEYVLNETQPNMGAERVQINGKRPVEPS